MRNRPTKRALCGFFRVNVNPLVVTRRIGKQIDLLLRDGQPVTDGNLLAHTRGHFGKSLKSFHKFMSPTAHLSLIQPFTEAFPLLQIFFNPARRHVKQR